ncbi:glycosyltransferase family 32 protein [Clostridium thermobutyricum]|uniref:glycosyltransferase family 32 protein n=1 Tax=Clostridium thermobutyricum TaxID=29372 RepID=UPI0018AB2D6C|nr:glycosyltransferase [Clostridium thermobutyricum]
MKIPKIIHYCWFGKGEKPKLLQDCMKSWNKLKKNGYKIIEWNEYNFDINENKYTREAYKNKKWAFVSDYVRLKVLYDYGGIYLDTDMEITQNLDEFLDEEMFMGFMVNCVLSTAIIGAIPKHNKVKKLIELYDSIDLDYSTPNNDILTDFMLKHYEEFKLNNSFQKFKDITIYPKEYFNNPTFIRSRNYSIHRYAGSWNKESANKRSLKGNLVKIILGDVIYYRILSYKLNKNSPFHEIEIKQKS